MKRFILKTLVLAVVFASICGANFLLNTLIIEHSEPPIRNEQVMIAGDSHPQFAINPDIFHSAENIAQTGEPYALTYWKLKYFFQNHHPEILLLGFAHHNISGFNDKKFQDPKWCGELFKRSYFIGDFESLSRTNVELDYSTYYQTYFREMFLFPHLDHFKFVGRYTPGKESRVADISSTIERHYYEDGKLLPVSESSLVYLDSIINLCAELKVRPVLVGTPVHKEYYKKIPQEIFDRYNKEKERLSSSGISVFDLTSDYFDESYFYDGDHLNEKGAFIFTHRVIQLLPPQEEPPIRLIKVSDR